MSQSVRGFRTEEKSQQQQQGLPPHISVRSVFPELKGKYCAFGGGATLEKSNLICLNPLLGFHLRLKQGAVEETLGKKTSIEVEMMMVEMMEACLEVDWQFLRLLADPAFLFKQTLEQGLTIGYGTWWECQHCGERISLPLPSVSTSALSHGAFLGVSANLQYQLLNGAERVMQQHFNHLGVVLFAPQCSVPEWFIPTRGLVSGFFKGKKDQSKEGKQHQNMLGKRKEKRKVHSRALITTF